MESIEWLLGRDIAIQVAKAQTLEKDLQRAERRAQIEKELAPLLRKRQENVSWKPSTPDWEPPKPFPIPREFRLEGLATRIAPHVQQFAVDYTCYEGSAVTGWSHAQKEEHVQRSLHAIMRLIFPRVRPEEPLPPGTKYRRLRLTPNGVFESYLDQQKHEIALRPAPSAERQGPVERGLPADSYGLFRFKRPRRLLRQAVWLTLQAEAVSIIADDRSRSQMVEDTRLRYGLFSDKEVYAAARIRATDFYRWRRSTDNRSVFHRHMIRVLNSNHPTWPPPVEW
jgi:hypothetical protein